MPVDVIQFATDTFDPVMQLVSSFIVNIPGLVGAAIVLIVGYLIGVVLGDLVHRALEKVKVDNWLVKIAKGHPLGNLTVADISGKLVKWYVFIAFLASAAGLVQLTVLAQLLTAFALWAPHLLMAIIVMVLGLIVAEFVAQEISTLKLKATGLLSGTARAFIIVFFAIYSLREIGLNVFIAEATFLIVIAGIMLAFAIGMGLGLQSHAEKILSGVEKSLK